MDLSPGALCGGAVLWTHARAQPPGQRAPPVATFADVVQRKWLSRCVLSTMVVEPEWLVAHGLSTVPGVLFADGEAAGTGRLGRLDVVFPPKARWGAMHAKVMLLEHGAPVSSFDDWEEGAAAHDVVDLTGDTANARGHKRRRPAERPRTLRVVVTSANLIRHDYTGVLNAMYVQDLPYASVGGRRRALPQFAGELMRMLRAMGLRAADDASLVDRFDWSAWAGGHAVWSSPVVPRTGMQMLARVVDTLGLRGPAAVEYQCSSLGVSSARWLRRFEAACRGETDLTADDNDVDKCGNVTLVFPTERYAQTKGETHFASLFCSGHGPPPAAMRQCVSLIGPSVPALHTKIASACSPDTRVPRWTYIGSANASRGAWGHGTTGRTAFVANWEFGIVVPASAARGIPGFDAETGGLLLPYDAPPAPYSPSDRPWRSTRRPCNCTS